MACSLSVVARETHPPRLSIRTFWRTRDPVRKRIDRRQQSHQGHHSRPLVRCRSSGLGVRGRRLHARELRRRAATTSRPTKPCCSIRASPRRTACASSRPTPRTRRRSASASSRLDIRSRDTLVDLAGALWLDRTNAESSVIRVRVHESGVVREGQRRRSLTFATMPNGVPMIVHWNIHSAIIAVDDDGHQRRSPQPASAPGANQRSRARLSGDGGEIGFVDWPDGTQWNLGLSRILGVVVDKAGERVPRARVWLTRPRHRRRRRLTASSPSSISSPGATCSSRPTASSPAQAIGRNIPARRLDRRTTRDVPCADHASPAQRGVCRTSVPPRRTTWNGRVVRAREQRGRTRPPTTRASKSRRRRAIVAAIR